VADLGSIGVDGLPKEQLIVTAAAPTGAIAVKGDLARPLIVATPLPMPTGLVKGLETKAMPDVGQASRLQPCCMVLGPSLSDYLVLGGRNNADGSPASPSLEMDTRGHWRFRWKVLTGARSIQISVKQAANVTPRPTMQVVDNSGAVLGTATAPSGTGYVTVGPITFTAASDQVCWVYLMHNYVSQIGVVPAIWDNLIRS
jgi:hypothetical protein